MAILFWIYIIGMIITACIYYLGVRVYNNIHNEKGFNPNKKRIILAIIFYPIIWVIFVLNEIADKLSE